MAADAEIMKPSFYVLVALSLLVAGIVCFLSLESSVTKEGKHITAAQARRLAVRFMEIRTGSPGKVGVDRIKYDHEQWQIVATCLPSSPGKSALMTMDDWGNVTSYFPTLE